MRPVQALAKVRVSISVEHLTELFSGPLYVIAVYMPVLILYVSFIVEDFCFSLGVLIWRRKCALGGPAQLCLSSPNEYFSYNFFKFLPWNSL
jgi:hypothetical protein